MRGVLAMLALALLAAPAAATAPARSELGRLALVDRSPVTVRGMQFKPGESVTVRIVVRAGPRVSKTVRASLRGTWVARFPAVRLPRCGSFVLRATGASGSTAAYTEHLPPCGAAP